MGFSALTTHIMNTSDVLDWVNLVFESLWDFLSSNQRTCSPSLHTSINLLGVIKVQIIPKVKPVISPARDDLVTWTKYNIESLCDTRIQISFERIDFPRFLCGDILKPFTEHHTFLLIRGRAALSPSLCARCSS